MGLYVSDKGGIDYEPIPMGLHRAICYTVADLGTQLNPTYHKEQRKVVLIWEIPEVRIEVEKDGKPVTLPRVISKVYTASLSDKAHLYADLVSWRGTKFTPEQLERFDLFTVAGANCQLNIVHETKDKKTYANISAIVPLLKAQWLTPENPIVTYSMDDDGESIPETLPEWIVKKIKESVEFTTGGQQTVPENHHDTISEAEDDLPF